MRQILADRSEGFLLIFPVLGKVGFPARGGAHAPEDRARNRVKSRVAGADHVDGNAFGLGQLGHIFRRHHAGIVRAIRKHNHHFTTGILAGIFDGHEQRIVESSVIAGHCGANPAQHLKAVRGERRRPGKVAAIGIERHPVRALEGTDKFSNRILGKDKTPIHIVAGVEQDENIGADHGSAHRRQSLRSFGRAI